MINVYSPTIQQICGTPPRSGLPTPPQVDFMNPPVPSGQGDVNLVAQSPQNMAYNYGPVAGQPMPYQQQRDFAAQQLQQELFSPFSPTTVQVGGYGGTPQYPYNNQYYNPYSPFANSIFEQQPQQQIIQGFNPLGAESIKSSDYDQKRQEIEEFYQDAAQKDMEQRNGNYQNYYNYYGNMNNGFIDATIASAYASAKQSLDSEAKDNRIEMNKQLSRIAHSYNGDTITDEELSEIYEDKVMPTPTGYNMYDQSQAMAMSRLQPYDGRSAYQQTVKRLDAEVSAKYNGFVKQDADIYEFFDNAGMILWDQWQQEGMRRRRNVNRIEEGEFKNFLQSQLQRRDPNNVNALEALRQTFPEGINEIAMGGMPDGMEILDDNTVKINYPVRKEVVNEQENDYQKSRYAFTNAIYNKGVCG